MFFTRCSPRSTKPIGSFSPTCSRAVALTQISPGSASASSRAATFDAVAEDVVVLDDDVADIDADAKANALALVDVGIAVFHALLHHDGAAHRIDDRGELDQEAVARSLDNMALVLGDQRIDQLPAMGLERGERPFLVGAHQARVSRHVRGEDGGEPARGARLLAHPLFAFRLARRSDGPLVDTDNALVRLAWQRYLRNGFAVLPLDFDYQLISYGRRRDRPIEKLRPHLTPSPRGPTVRGRQAWTFNQ